MRRNNISSPPASDLLLDSVTTCGIVASAEIISISRKRLVSYMQRSLLQLEVKRDPSDRDLALVYSLTKSFPLSPSSGSLTGPSFSS
jgi:hypothetical protein